MTQYTLKQCARPIQPKPSLRNEELTACEYTLAAVSQIMLGTLHTVHELNKSPYRPGTFNTNLACVCASQLVIQIKN